MVNLLDLVVRMQQLNVTLDQAGRVSISGTNKHVEQHTPIAKVVARKSSSPKLLFQIRDFCLEDLLFDFEGSRATGRVLVAKTVRVSYEDSLSFGSDRCRTLSLVRIILTSRSRFQTMLLVQRRRRESLFVSRRCEVRVEDVLRCRIVKYLTRVCESSRRIGGL